jgi:hypothetical protein
MSKFDELCQSANKALVDLHRLREQCYQFGANLAKGLVAYLECPPDRAKHFLLKDGTNPAPARCVEEATYIDDEGWWHLGLCLDLTAGPMGTLGTCVFINLVFKMAKDHYLVRFGRDKKQFTIHPNVPAEFTVYYEHFFQAMKDHFDKDVERFLDRKERRFGFI